MTDKLDKKDLKILHQLDLNARQSHTEIAKKAGISKDSVGYRIKRLETIGIIRGYHTIIDCSCLGYRLYRINLKLVNTNLEKFNDIIEFLKKNNHIMLVSKRDGLWDLDFSMWIKKGTELNNFYINEFCPLFKSYIKEISIESNIVYQHNTRNYLSEEKNSVKLTQTIGENTLQKFDDIDLQILKILSGNARIKLVELANKIKVDSMTIYHRIKKLETSKIIAGYRVNLNLTKLKRFYYSIFIKLNDFSELKEIKQTIHSLPEETGITTFAGSYDLRFDLEVSDSTDYFRIIALLQNKFNSIREIEYTREIDMYKFDYMPF